MLDPIEIRPLSKTNLIKTIRIPAGGRKQLVFRLTDENGKAVDLTKEIKNCPAPLPQFEAEPRAGENNTEIRLRAISQYDPSRTLLDVVGQIVHEQPGENCQAKSLPAGQTDLNEAVECDGLVSFELTHENTCRAGVYRCEIQRVVRPDFLVETWPAYFSIEPSLFNHEYMSQFSGIITIPEIRLAMSDLQQGEVDLLDRLEFNDTEILYALRQPVDMWNETPPIVTQFTTEYFPYRYNWTQATIGILLRMRAHNYRRNNLEYSAGGISLNDQDKEKDYGPAAAALLSDYNQWMRRTKLAMNIRRTWRSGI